MALVDVSRTIVVLLAGFIVTGIHAAAVTVTGRINPLSAAVQRIIQHWARQCLRLTRIELDVRGIEHVDTRRSHVVIANHLSNLDVVVMFLAIPLPIRYLAKKELFRVPLLAQAMRSVGIVEVDRGGRAAAIKSVNEQSEKVIARGYSLIIFPEGTRSRDGEPKTFKKGAFMMAAAANMPVLPVVIAGTHEIWAPGSLIRPGGRVEVQINPPVETVGMSSADIERLRQESEAQISGQYHVMRRRVVEDRQS